MPNDVKIVDNFELSEKKLVLEEIVIDTLRLAIPNCRIATPTHPYRSYYTNFVVRNEHPSREYLDYDLKVTSFGVLGPKPADTRLKIFGLPIGPSPTGDLIGTIKIVYEKKAVQIKGIQIKVFGKENKELFLTFIEKLDSPNIAGLVGSVTLELKSSEPRLEGVDYLNIWE